MVLGHIARFPAWQRPFLVCLWLLLMALPGAAQVKGERVAGDWEQFIFFPDTSTWRSAGVYRVEQVDGEYRMSPVNQVQAPDLTNSRGLTNVRFSGSDWLFNSDWGNGNVGEFRLRRIGPGVYQGWSYLGEKQINPNIWLLVH